MEMQTQTEVNKSDLKRSLIEKLESNNSRLQSIALFTILHEEGKDGYLNKVVRCLESDNEEVRLATVMVLSRMKSKEVVPLLEKQLDDKNGKIRIQAAFGLSNKRNRKSIPILTSVIEKDYPDHSIYKRAIEALGKFKDDSMVSVFKIAINHRRKDSRRKATAALKDINTKKAYEVLHEALSKEKDSAIEMRIIQALKEMKF